MRFASADKVWLLLSLAVLILSGCSELRLKAVNPDERAAKAAEAEQQESGATKKTANADSRTGDALPAAIQVDGWNAALAPEPPIDRSQGRRWRHLDLEKILVLSDDERPDFAAALSSSNAILATNAAICLARLGDCGGRRQLKATVDNRQLRLQLRCAAAEALAETDDPAPLDVLRELATRYGDSASAAYLPELHAELLYGLAARVDAGNDERFAAAVTSPASIVRLAAIRGWLQPGSAPLPEEAADLRTDPDHRVRAAALRAMALRHHSFAFDAARGGLTDFRLEVRLAAIAALGAIGGDDARKALEGLEREADVIRAAAVSALARLGARDRVWAAADSDSWHVRKAVAAALVEWPDASGVLLARRFLSDGSVEVQKELLAMLAKWPLDAAGPVLLEAMAGNAYLSRKTAASQLAQRWPPARDFRADAPPDRRDEAMLRLRDEWGRQFGVAALAADSSAGSGKTAEQTSPHERAERAREIVKRLQEPSPSGKQKAAALAELAAFGPELPAVLAQLADEEHLVLPDAVVRGVLPKYGGEYEEVERLSSKDVQQRRRATAKLALLAEERPLGILALARLAEIGSAEPDPLVWAGMLRAIANDNREPATRLAYAGVSHSSAEVRRESIEYLAAHPSPAHAQLILPAIKDKNQAVVVAAVKLLGHPGMLTDVAPLEAMLVTNDRNLRLALAESLIALDAPSGYQTLELLAHDTDMGTRQKAAQLMGEVGDRRFTETLIGLLGDSLGVRTAALTSLPKVVGRDIADVPDDPPTSTLDRVERWRRWWSEQGKP